MIATSVAEAADLALLLEQAVARRAPREGRDDVERSGEGAGALGLARQRIQADDEVEPAARHEIEVRGRADAAVHEAAVADLDRAVEAGNRARGGDSVRKVGARGADAPERSAPAGAVVTGDGPVVRVVDPAARDDAAHGLLERVGRDEAGRKPAGDHLERRVPQRVRQRRERHAQRSGAERGQAAVDPEDRAGRAVRLGGRPAVGAREPVEHLAARVGHHEPRGHAGRHERPDHRAGGGADDVLRGAGVPVRLARERVEPADEPCAAEHATRAEDQPHLHRDALPP